MKYLLLLFVLLSCRPEPMATPAPDFNPTFVPIWRTDTMVNSYRKGTDTLYSLMIGDTSAVIYNGDTLYIFGIFDTTKTSSATAWIGTSPLDTSTSLSRCVVSYYRYWNAGSNKQVYATQIVGITTRYPNFNTTGDSYYLGK